MSRGRKREARERERDRGEKGRVKFMSELLITFTELGSLHALFRYVCKQLSVHVSMHVNMHESVHVNVHVTEREREGGRERQKGWTCEIIGR